MECILNYMIGYRDSSSSNGHQETFTLLCCTPEMLTMSCQWAFTRYVKLRVVHATGMPGKFFLPPRISDPDMHHDTSVTHVPWCMPGSLTSSFLWSRWRGKRSRHPRRMRDSQFYVSGKRPMQNTPQQRMSLYIMSFDIIIVSTCHH